MSLMEISSSSGRELFDLACMFNSADYWKSFKVEVRIVMNEEDIGVLETDGA